MAEDREAGFVMLDVGPLCLSPCIGGSSTRPERETDCGEEFHVE